MAPVRDVQLLKSSQTTRQQVFGDVRQSLDRLKPSIIQAAQAEYERIMSTETPRPVVDGHLVDNFIAKHTAVNGTLKIVGNYSEVPGAVGEFLDSHDLPSRMLMGSSEFLSQFDWPQEWQIDRRIATKTDLVSVTDAVCAIAETGTIMIFSSSNASSTHAFVPENHVAIINAGQVVRHLDDALKIASTKINDNTPGVHMVTGPSKTADVEQTIQYGAHGPRRLHVIIIDTK